MKPLTYSLIAAALACGFAAAQTTAYTTPVGYVTQSCLSNSDTVVSVPLRNSAVYAGALSAAADTTTTPGSAILSLAGTPGLTADAFAGTHYAKFSSGASDGRWFAITANGTASLTINLNGATLTTAAGDTVEVIKLWTLATLFDPATATTDPATTPNAIVASTSTAPAGRRTEVVIPDLTGIGSNLAPNKNFYIHGGFWKQVGQGTTNFNNFILWPDNHFIIRNPATVATATSYIVSGEVDMNNVVIDLATDATVKQDNYVGLLRPVDVTLNQLTLGGTAGFVASTSSAPAGRRDEVLVYDNATPGINKSPLANYYYFNAAWRKVGQAATIDAGTDVIKAGNGVVVRKYQAAGGVTATWDNLPNY